MERLKNNIKLEILDTLLKDGVNSPAKSRPDHAFYADVNGRKHQAYRVQP